MASKIPSEFVPLDVNYAHDRSIRTAGPMAELLFIRSIAYSRRTRSFGHIPDYDLPVVGAGIPAPARHAAALSRSGLWVAEDGGWRIRSWEKWNPTATAQVKVRQSEGGALGNHNRWHTDGKGNPDCLYCENASVGDRSTDHSTESVGDRSRIAEVEREVDRERELSSEVADATPRPEIDTLLDLLDQRIRENGAKVPNRTRKNRDATRLLLDKDGHTVEQVTAAIEWCQADEFWRSNILSMSKLREKYDQLRLAASRATTTRTTDRQGELLRREMARAQEADARNHRQIGA